METRQIDTGLYIETCGAGETIVLIPGLKGRASFWRPVARYLAAGFHVLAFDHPGVGQSRSRGAQRIESIVDGLLEAMEWLGIANAHIVGHSTGGLIAQALALDHAPRVDRVVLSCTWAEPDRRFRDLFEVRKRVLREIGIETYQGLADLLAYSPAMYPRGPDSMPEPASAHPADPSVVEERIDMLLDYVRASELGAIQAPVRIIGSADDCLVPMNHARHLAKLIHHADLVTVEGGHFPQIADPKRYASVLTDFFTS